MTFAARQQSPSHWRESQMTLGMAHLAPRGLSEDWWLKHLGDVHWQLIADAVGQNTVVFRDRQGRQLYAAFCATEFRQFHPNKMQLGETLEVRSELWAAGRSRIQSNHSLIVQGVEVARFRLISTFVAHIEAGVNASVKRAAPYLIPVLQTAPDDFAKRTSDLAKENRQKPFKASQTLPLATHIATDFNAVGLLYFPSFTRLFEQVEAGLTKSANWSPVAHRTVLYFGNIELCETVNGAAASGSGFELWNSRCDVSKQLLATCSVERH